MDEVMNKLHNKELCSRMSNMTAEENESASKGIRTEVLLNEIKRREEATANILKEVGDLMTTKYSKDLSLMEKEALIQELRDMLKVREEG